eukprot:3566622-Rhodomonas_salina.1
MRAGRDLELGAHLLLSAQQPRVALRKPLRLPLPPQPPHFPPHLLPTPHLPSTAARAVTKHAASVCTAMAALQERRGRGGEEDQCGSRGAVAGLELVCPHPPPTCQRPTPTCQHHSHVSATLFHVSATPTCQLPTPTCQLPTRQRARAHLLGSHALSLPPSSLPQADLCLTLRGLVSVESRGKRGRKR